MWIVLLGSALRVLFGAEMSGGWLIVGGVMTLALGGVILVANEVKEAIFVPAFSAMEHWNFEKRPAIVNVTTQSTHALWDKNRRTALGLLLECPNSNCRRRQPIRKSAGQRSEPRSRRMPARDVAPTGNRYSGSSLRMDSAVSV